jgi:hypothetical protein
MEETKELFDFCNRRNLINNFPLLTEMDCIQFKFFINELKITLSKIDKTQLFTPFLNLETDPRFLLYFDFTFADGVSLNTDLLRGVLIGVEYPEFINIDRPEEIFGPKYSLSENEKFSRQNPNVPMRIPFINNCDLDTSKECPHQIYKRINYMINNTIANIELDTNDDKDLFDLLNESYAR